MAASPIQITSCSDQAVWSSSGPERKPSQMKSDSSPRATDYMGLVNFEEEEVTEPPLTKRFTNAELVSFVKRTIFYNIEIPCHTQNIERMVEDDNCRQVQDWL